MVDLKVLAMGLGWAFQSVTDSADRLLDVASQASRGGQPGSAGEWGSPYRIGKVYVTVDEWTEWAMYHGQVDFNDAYHGRITPNARYSPAKIARLTDVAQRVQREADRNYLRRPVYYRGESYATEAEVVARYPVGSTIVQDRLTSVSEFQPVAAMFASYDRHDVNIRVRITYLNTGAPARPTLQGTYVFLGYQSHEAVLPIGARFRVELAEKRVNGYEITLAPTAAGAIAALDE